MRGRVAKVVRIAMMLLAAAAVTAVAVALIVLAIAHAPPLQRAAWSRVVEVIRDATGWEVSASEVGARLLWSPSIVLEDLRVDDSGRTIASADRIAIKLRWRSLLARPARIDAVTIDGLDLDLRNLELPRPPSPRDGAEPPNPWRVLEVGGLRLRGARVGATVADLDLQLDEAAVGGSLTDGAANAQLKVGGITLTRAGRRLVVGPLELTATASETSIAIEPLELQGDTVRASLDLSADLNLGTAEVVGELDLALAPLAEWYEPALALLVEPKGTLRLHGEGALSAEHGIEAVLFHVGDPIEVAGYSFERLELVSDESGIRLETSDASWGEVSARLQGQEGSFRARLDRAVLGPAMARLVGPLPSWLPAPISVTGTIEGTTLMPFDPEQVSGRFDLRASAPGARAELTGEGRGLAWRADRLGLELPGARISGRASIDGSGPIRGALSVDVDDPSSVVAYGARWLQDVGSLAVAGGPARAEVEVGGTLTAPTVDASFRWTEPSVGGVSLAEVRGSAAGGMEQLSWELTVLPVEGGRVALEGTAAPRQPSVDGTWTVEVAELAAMADLAAPSVGDRLVGAARGEGSFHWDPGGATGYGDIGLDGVRFDGWAIDGATATIELSPDRLRVDRFEVRALGGSAVGSASVDLGHEASDRRVEAELRWRGINPALAPIALPSESAAGRVDGELLLSGTVVEPSGELQLEWHGESDRSAVQAGTVRAVLSEGRVRLISDGLETAAGPLALTGTLPLGDLTRPEGLWPDAPHGPLELTLSGAALDLSAMAALVGRATVPVEVVSDVGLQVRWSLIDPVDRMGRLLMEGLSIRHAGGEITAPDGIEVTVDRGLLVLQPSRLVGPRGTIAVAGEIDPESLKMRLEIDGEMSPEVADLIPFPIRISEPLKLHARVAGPLAAPEGTLEVEHEGGTIVLREPAVEVTDLHLSARLSDGALWVEDGSAGFNRGRVSFGGGWDRVSGQGMVIEAESVTFFASGTLTRWDGVLAIEPDPEVPARVVGELVLGGGVWEQQADIAGAFLAGSTLEPAADDPLRGIALDLTVRARTGIRVDNNLGRFDVRWDRLRVGGTAAQPVIRGDIRIAPGGVVNLPGKRVELQRGTIRFTGDPTVDPVLELVPVEDLANVEGGASGTVSGIDTYALAAQTLYGGVGRALGFENETLQPAQIAVETETDLSSQFLLGQRLSPNLAFFFAANPTDVQDRTTMLQLWNLNFDPGLAVQAYQKTLEERSGITALQRFQWGGSAGRVGLPFSRGPSAAGDRPVVHRVRLDGDWPISKRQLKRAAGLRRGAPYDPFLDFVAEVHLEQRLAAEGYPEADVRGRIEGSERSPTLVYTCDAGPYQHIEFVGDVPPKRIQREVRALYMPPPLERVALENMRQILQRHFQAEGFPFATVEVERGADRLVLAVAKGEPLQYRGPIVEGVPERGAALIRDIFGSPAELAAAVQNPDRAGRVVTSVLTAIGYTNSRLEAVVPEPVEKGAQEVRFVIDPGEVTRIAAVEQIGRDPLGATDELGDAVAVGAPLDRRAIDDRMAEIRRVYQQSGYDQASIRAVPRQREDGSWVVVVELEPGIQRELAEVQFSGLRHIRPRYLRPGLQLEDGDLLNVFEVDESAIRIANFAPVERLEVTTRPTGVGGSVVDFEVFEKPRWTVELGLGWDNEKGTELRTGIRDDNLFGRGVGANLRLRWNSVERVALLYGSLPPLPGRRLSFGGTLGYREEDRELVLDLGGRIPYQETEGLASLDLNYELSPGTTLKPYVRYTRTRFDYQTDLINLDRTITATTIGTAIFHDRFDNPFDPRSGYSVVGDLGWSTSYLGSDVDTVQAVASGSLALAPSSGWTWLQTARLGVAEPLMGTVLDPAVKFKAGGQGSIRGFDRDSVGPVGIAGQPAGGGALFILNEELRIPVWRSVRGAVFTDVGQVWESWGEADARLSMAVGLGLRWTTPIGLVWGDVAWPVANVGASSRDPKFYLGVGRPF